MIAVRARPAVALVAGAAAALAVAACGPGGEEDGRADAAAAGRSAAPPAASPAPIGPWADRIAVDSGGGRVGPWRMNESDWRYVDDAASATGGRGATVVAWVDQARRDVRLQVFGPDGRARLEEPADVSRSSGIFSWLPRVAVAPGDPDRIHVLWQEIVFSGGSHGGEAFHALSTDGGRTFSGPTNLSRSEAGDGKGRLTAERWDNGSLSLAVAPGGRVYAAWTAYEGPLWLARSTDGGASFSAPLRVGGGEGSPARGPDLAVGPGDTVRLAWAVGEDASADLRMAVSTDGGRSFGDPRLVHPDDARDDAPKIEVAGDGTLHLAWVRKAAGPAERSRSTVLYARSPPGEEGFGPAREPGADHAAGFGPAGEPELAVVGRDTVLVAAGLYPDRPGLSRGFGLAVSVDGGDAFGGPAVIPGTVPREGAWTGSLQGAFRRRLAAAPGRVVFTWTAFRPEVASRVWLLRGSLAEVASGGSGDDAAP